MKKRINRGRNYGTGGRTDRMGLRISTDIGGTFTDLVAVDEIGNMKVVKVSTTSSDFSKGVFDALNLLAAGDTQAAETA